MKAIKINNFSPISYKARLGIIQEFLKTHEKKVENKNGWMDTPNTDFKIRTTGKFPVQVTVGNRRYSVRCREVKCSYILDVWFAS